MGKNRNFINRNVINNIGTKKSEWEKGRLGRESNREWKLERERKKDRLRRESKRKRGTEWEW